MPIPLPAGSARCRICGQTLAAETTGEVCEAQVCQTRARVEQQGKLGVTHIDRKERAWALAQKRAAPLLEELARRLGFANASELPTTITPYIELPSRERSVAEVIDFVEYLTGIVHQVFTSDPDTLMQIEVLAVSLRDTTGEVTAKHIPKQLSDLPPEDSDQPQVNFATLADAFAKRDQEAEPDPLALNATCIACGGHCCTTGLRHHAYLKPFDIAYYRHHHPDATPATLIADYLSRIPDQSIVQACLYLTETGCALPRQLRSTTCNGWQCSYRKKLGADIRKMGDGVSAVVGLAQDHDTDPSEGAPMARAITVRNGVLEVHSDLRLPALDDLPGPD